MFEKLEQLFDSTRFSTLKNFTILQWLNVVFLLNDTDGFLQWQLLQWCQNELCELCMYTESIIPIANTNQC